MPDTAVKNIENELRAFRGGSWYGVTGFCRASSRSRNTPDDRRGGLGFRVALSSPQDRISLPSSVLPSYGSRLPRRRHKKSAS